MISRIAIKGFKCFREQNEVRFAPITILVGPNNSGKSAIIQSILLLKQTIESRGSDPILQLEGPDFDFGTYRDIVSGNQLTRGIRLEAEVSDTPKGESETWTIDFASRKRGRLVIARRLQLLRRGQQILDARADSKGQFYQVVVDLPSSKSSAPAESSFTIVGKKRIEKYFHRLHFALFQKFEFADLLRTKLRNAPGKDPMEHHVIWRREYAQDQLFGAFNTISYIGPLREFPKRIYSYSGRDFNGVGNRGEFSVPATVKYADRRSFRAKRFWKKTNDWFRAAGLAHDIKPFYLTPRHFELRVRGLHSDAYENIADVGFGNSQVLPIVVDILMQPEETTHVIEQPEIHLHPKAQCELANLFLLAFQAKKQVIVETHSLDMLIRFRRLLAEGKLKAEDIAVYYVGQESGGVRVQRIDFRQDFSFANWPKGFFEERSSETLQLMRETARANG